MAELTRNCDECGAEYVARNAQHRFCSQACRNAFHAKRLEGALVTVHQMVDNADGVFVTVKCTDGTRPRFRPGDNARLGHLKENS